MPNELTNHPEWVEHEIHIRMTYEGEMAHVAALGIANAMAQAIAHYTQQIEQMAGQLGQVPQFQLPQLAGQQTSVPQLNGRNSNGAAKFSQG